MKFAEFMDHLEEGGEPPPADADVMFVVAEDAGEPGGPAYPCEVTDVRYVAGANVLEIEVEAVG